MVALRKESVDRNPNAERPKKFYGVALRKESVDRNTISVSSSAACWCRSPQGERG